MRLDPGNNPAGNLTEARAEHTATLLSDGRVLVTGGFNGASALKTTELFEPNTNRWRGAGAMLSPRRLHTATLLPDNTVLVAGGMRAGLDAITTSYVIGFLSAAGTLAATFALWSLPADEFLFTPERAKSLENRVHVEGARPARGESVHYVEVFVRRASFLERLLPFTRPDGSAVVPEEALLPPGTTEEERDRQTAQEMERSEEIAALVAALAVLGLLAVGTIAVLGILLALFGGRAGGADEGISGDRDEVLNLVRHVTGGVGADGVIITASSESDAVVSQAFAMCRRKGRVVLVGDVGLNLNRADLYEKEIDFLVSCSYGPGRYDEAYERKGLDYPLGYVRWTEQRNLSAVLALMADGSLRIAPLISHRFPIERASAAYDLIRGSDAEPFLGVVLTFDLSGTVDRVVHVRRGNVHRFAIFLPETGVEGADIFSARLAESLRPPEVRAGRSGIRPYPAAACARGSTPDPARHHGRHPGLFSPASPRARDPRSRDP